MRGRKIDGDEFCARGDRSGEAVFVAVDVEHEVQLALVEEQRPTGDPVALLEEDTGGVGF